MRPIPKAGAILFLVAAVAGGCGGGDEFGGRGEAAQLAQQVEQVTGAYQARFAPDSGRILCDVLAAALPEMEARAGNPDHPHASSTAFRLYLEKVRKSKPGDYDKILGLQVSDPEAADAATTRECPRVRERVLELVRQQDVYWLLLGSLS